MTEQVIEQAVAEHPVPSKTAAQEVPVNSISQAVNGSQPTSSGNNTTAVAETQVGEAAVAETQVGEAAVAVTQVAEAAVAVTQVG
jgi:hypothetical protein